jgi:hypothetical protein
MWPAPRSAWRWRFTARPAILSLVPIEQPLWTEFSPDWRVLIRPAAGG